MHKYTHLHCHTQYSILDGATSLKGLVAKVKEDGMEAIAITDHGNLFGVKAFHEIATREGIKPILGCEAYVARRTINDQKDQVDRSGNHLIILAKNEVGYRNLVKLISFSHIRGFYYKPRIDKDMLKEHHDGLIILSACLGGEVCQHIMKDDIEAAEQTVLWYKELFGDDYYLEIQRHPCDDPKLNANVYQNQMLTNKVILELGAKHGVKVVCTNDCHFINESDALAHDRLICLNTGKDLDDPNRMRYTKQEWVKTQAEMNKLFADVPTALANTQEVMNKVENYKLDSDPIMPPFPLPEGFNNEDDYLKHITYQGAQMRWGELTDELQERIDFELNTIKRMGFPGYFLIVWDFIKAAREMGVIVGPGRGSAAGSAVAYAIQITNIDPIKYDLLFERFLNPDRISMPDIDIDFDDDGREQVLHWVENKYGHNRVAHIITFGTMAAKMAIRDVARVQKLPLPEADKLAKLIPDGPKVSLKKAYAEVPELKELAEKGETNVRDTLRYAGILEGSVRQTGVHACGVIIGRDDLWNYIPVTKAKDAQLMVTQYDGGFVESIGMLKMDFLGLKTLSIIKECLANIKLSKDIDIDIDTVSLEDEKTFQLYSNGDTTAIFQFESPGMKKHLRSLKPNRFEDLVAMNALYRPGPMEYIPSFINRKHGREKIVYDHPIMADYLQDSYGITVFQEQVMLQSRALGGFTRGQSDSLRKAMGKKKIDLMNKLKVLFIEGCKNNPKFMEGCQETGKEPDKLIEKIWGDWEAFAKYAFNKSHSVCYAYVSYQTAYLKAHYPAEFMASVLSRNLSDIKKITIFMDECRRMGLNVAGPDVNHSYTNFTVDKKGQVRFGMGAVKGVGESAVAEIIRERNAKGEFTDVFDFVERVQLSIVNKRNIEALALAGGLDCFGLKREQYFAENENKLTLIDLLVKYGNNVKNSAGGAPTLFGDSEEMAIPKPPILTAQEWSAIEKLNREKELVGIYLSAHPLDDYKLIINTFCNTTLSEFSDFETLKDKELKVAGMVTSVEHRTTKTGKPFGSITIEDYSDSYQIMMFSNDYMAYKSFFEPGYQLYLTGRVQHRFGNQQADLEFKVNNIQMLSEVQESRIKSLALKIKISDIQDGMVEKISNITEQHKGETPLKFLVYDEESNVWVQMFSRNRRISVDQELIQKLDELPELEYRIF